MLVAGEARLDPAAGAEVRVAVPGNGTPASAGKVGAAAQTPWTLANYVEDPRLPDHGKLQHCGVKFKRGK